MHNDSEKENAVRDKFLADKLVLKYEKIISGKSRNAEDAFEQ